VNVSPSIAFPFRACTAACASTGEYNFITMDLVDGGEHRAKDNMGTLIMDLISLSPKDRSTLSTITVLDAG
jgi:hypothetical protein